VNIGRLDEVPPFVRDVVLNIGAKGELPGGSFDRERIMKAFAQWNLRDEEFHYLVNSKTPIRQMSFDSESVLRIEHEFSGSRYYLPISFCPQSSSSLWPNFDASLTYS